MRIQRGVISRMTAIAVVVVLFEYSHIGAVAAARPVFEVEVTNLPSKSIPVVITNTPGISNDLPVRASDNPAFQPVLAKFHTDADIGDESLALFDTGFYTVPTGKQLVIEFVTSEVFADPGIHALSGKILLRLVIVNPSGRRDKHTLGISAEGVRCTRTQICFPIAKEVRLYAGPDSQLAVEGIMSVSTNTAAFMNGTITGYLVDLPPGP